MRWWGPNAEAPLRLPHKMMSARDGTGWWPSRFAPFGASVRGLSTYADYKPLTFHDAARRFTDGNDDPRAYLERCLETITQREPVVKAFTATNEAGARAAADASAARWKAGRPLSPIDGMPIAIKDLLETKDMPTEMGC